MIEVTGVHIETFTIFATWLVNKSNNNVFGPLHQNPISGYYWPAGMPLIELYIFAEEYEIPQLGEDALRRFTSPIYHAGGKDCTPHSFAVDIETIRRSMRSTTSTSELLPTVLSVPSLWTLSAPPTKTWTTRL
jgi:hypothetical protein